MSQVDMQTQVQMIWPEERRQDPPPVELPAGYTLRLYQPGDETRFYQVMALAGWPGWDEAKLQPWLFRILPQGWFMAVHQTSNQIVASAMATHDHTWLYPFCGEVGWLAADPAHTGRGLGTAVTAAVTARFIAAGYRCIHLYTEIFRLPALKIYLKLGYIPFLTKPESPGHWRTICEQLNWPFTPDAWQSSSAIISPREC